MLLVKDLIINERKHRPLLIKHDKVLLALCANRCSYYDIHCETNARLWFVHGCNSNIAGLLRFDFQLGHFSFCKQCLGNNCNAFSFVLTTRWKEMYTAIAYWINPSLFTESLCSFQYPFIALQTRKRNENKTVWQETRLIGLYDRRKTDQIMFLPMLQKSDMKQNSSYISSLQFTIQKWRYI